MQVNVQRLSPVLVEFDVEIAVDRVKSEVEKAYTSVAKTARVSGFRPGRAPRKVLAHLYGPRIAADVAQRLVDETYPQAISEQKLQPVTDPAIEPRRLEEGKAFGYKARVEVLPLIEGVGYDGLEATRSKVEVSPEQVTERLDQLRRSHSTLEPLKAARPSQKGDVVTIDFTLSVDGSVIDDAGATDFQAELGGGQLIPEIETALLDKNIGDQAEAKVDMPAQHPHPKLAGKSAVFALTLKDLKERVLPEADDEFAKDVGDFETLEALKKDISGTLEKASKEESDNKLAEQLVIELVEGEPGSGATVARSTPNAGYRARNPATRTQPGPEGHRRG